ncbi:hypothetical protein K2173_007635 [Erythroxylum novogranatense]|uniref:Uncharacterized protein n=1 Tax=Erythroxylum novogranatense TaxID=1862640 RepID=A0AAV8TU71_9ROSI|nr:hypothetical protein K2173_007635 [Erythroxylum novogranatense]
MDAVTTSDIFKDATKVVAKIIGKPESIQLISIRGLGLSVNGKLNSTVAEILQTKFFLIIDNKFYLFKFLISVFGFSFFQFSKL